MWGSMIRDDVIYGEIEGVKEGDIFEDRKALMRAKVQSGWVTGIATGGAAIALNEGYKDDIDNGDVIIPEVLRKWMGNQEIIEAK